MANQIAEEHDLLNHGQVGELIGHYLFTRKPDELEIVLPETEVLLEQRLRRHPHVEYYSPQVLLTRQKRQFVPKGGHHSAVRKFNHAFGLALLSPLALKSFIKKMFSFKTEYYMI